LQDNFSKSNNAVAIFWEKLNNTFDVSKYA
jgi:hypothetical protein